MRETDLYPPVKALLEAQGFMVKSEIGPVDVVALRGADPPVIVELKLRFSLALMHQCLARQSATNDVYMAVLHRSGKAFGRAVKDNVKLARRLGLGVMTVRPSDALVTVHCDPKPFVPRAQPRRQAALLREFARRSGDPNAGGQARQGLVTAYRQDALRLAGYLRTAGPSKGADVARETGVHRATRMMADDHYGWFDRVTRGIYRLSPAGRTALNPEDSEQDLP